MSGHHPWSEIRFKEPRAVEEASGGLALKGAPGEGGRVSSARLESDSSYPTPPRLPAIARRLVALHALFLGVFVGMATVIFVGLPTLILRGRDDFWRVTDAGYSLCDWASERLS